MVCFSGGIVDPAGSIAATVFLLAKKVCKAVDSFLKGRSRQKMGLMWYPPDWFQGSWIAREPGNDMPMNMGKLVAKEFIVDLFDLVDFG